MAQPERVADDQPRDLLVRRERKVRQPPLVQPHVPSHSQPVLALRLLLRSVVVRFNLEQRSEDVLVLVSVGVSKRHRLELLVVVQDVRVVQPRVRVGLPQLLEPVGLRVGQRPGANLGLLVWRFHEPREELLVRDERLPLGEVQVHVRELLRGGPPRHPHGRIARQEDHHLVVDARDEAEGEDVPLAREVALEHHVA